VAGFVNKACVQVSSGIQGPTDFNLIDSDALWSNNGGPYNGGVGPRFARIDCDQVIPNYQQVNVLNNPDRPSASPSGLALCPAMSWLLLLASVAVMLLA
jgi:hypothetical protein